MEASQIASHKLSNTEIYKFGGASLQNPDRVKQVVEIIKNKGSKPLLVVVSAMGKMTNQLEQVIKAHINHNTAERSRQLNNFFQFHDAMVAALFSPSHTALFNDLHNLKTQLQWVFDEQFRSEDAIYDQLIVFGELFSSCIVSHALRDQIKNVHHLDVRSIVCTDDHYRDASVLWNETQERVNKHLIPLIANQLVVTQGFIGATLDNYSSSLGREGSDYTAALLGNLLDAQRVTVWKDVPGVLNADPRYFQNARLIDTLSYHDAVELTYYGATVLHPKTIKPLQNKGIPLTVRSFIDTHLPGTTIYNIDLKDYKPKTSYILKKGLMLVTAFKKDLEFISDEHISKIYHILWNLRVKVHLMQVSAISISFCCDTIIDLDAFLSTVSTFFTIKYNPSVQLLTIRNYQDSKSAQVIEGKTVLLEQRTRQTCQYVLSETSQ